MQHFKDKFSNLNYFDTFTNVQKCLRLNDLLEIGDGTHYLSFEMIGLFSFRQWTVPQSIDFFMEFLNRLNLKPNYVTIHPDKLTDWSKFYKDYSVLIKPDSECKWSDGNIGGYCTEFYINNIEIGNIVNPLGTCIDVGFGLERLLQVSDSLIPKPRLQILEETCLTLINSGVTVGNKNQNYILKKLITESVLEGSLITSEPFSSIRSRQVSNFNQYLKNKDKPKYKDKTSEFWLDTFGVDTQKIPQYQKVKKIWDLLNS